MCGGTVSGLALLKLEEGYGRCPEMNIGKQVEMSLGKAFYAGHHTRWFSWEGPCSCLCSSIVINNTLFHSEIYQFGLQIIWLRY